MSNIKGYHCDVVIVDEAKQITWEDMEVKEEVEPFGLSPEYITAATLEQMRLQQGSIEWQREYYGTFEWPEDESVCGIDLAKEDSDITGILIIGDISTEEFDLGIEEWYRDNIARVFGVPKGVLKSKSDSQFNWAHFMSAVFVDSLCAPSRNQITGGKQ